MALVLGVSCGYHEAAAALIADGRIVAAVAEERLTRIKHDPSLPRQAMRACLARAGLPAAALDAVVFYENPYAKLERVLVQALAVFPRAWRQFPRAMAAQLGSKIWVLDALAQELAIPRAKISYCTHHEAHAASAFYTSPFASAAVLVVDGVGEDICSSLWHGEHDLLSMRASQAFPHSLGLFYAAITAYLGFSINDGEYKVMGLAAYGRPAFESQFQALAQLHDDGHLTLGLPYFAAHADSERGFGPKLESLLGPRRPTGKPWQFEGAQLHADDQRWADIAATLQAFTERTMLGFARRARAITGESALCLAGGVALNAVANRRIAAEAGFARVFVQPAAGDAGGALGAAILGALRAGDPRPAPMTHAALGVDVDAAEALQLARALGLQAARVSQPAEAAAREVAGGAVVAWAQGRSEWGPRALGQRSLLALPTHHDMRERINRMIKRREPFRPFAPAVLAEEAERYFEPVAGDLGPFMTSVASVRSEARATLQAVTHVDGTARLQTVTSDSAPGFAELLPAIARETGRGIVLNTSLNGAGEPMVARAADALAFFIAHPVDVLYVNDVCIRAKHAGGPRTPA